MSFQWINSIANLKSSCILINRLKVDELRRLIKEFATQTDQEKIRPFPTENLSQSDWPDLLLALSSLLSEPRKYLMKPTTYQDYLVQNLNIDTSLAEELIKDYTSKVNNELGDLNGIKTLENIAWEMGVEAASNLCGRNVVPAATIQLTLKGSSEKEETLALNLCQKDLLELYNTLEDVQNQLDSNK